MTIKGPYLVEAKLKSGSYETLEEYTEAEMYDIYYERTTRHFMESGSSGKPLEIVWFTDLGTQYQVENPGPHQYFELKMEATIYSKAERNEPAPETYTDYSLLQVPTTGSPAVTSARLYPQYFSGIGKTMWRSRLLQDADTRYPLLANYSEDARWSIFSFNDRTFDFARLHLTIMPEAAMDFTAVYDLEIEAKPDIYPYRAQYIDSTILEIQIASTGVARTDERWMLKNTSYALNSKDEKLSILKAAEPWGEIDGLQPSGLGDYPYLYIVYVDTSYFSRILCGRTCQFDMHINNTWNAVSQHYVETEDKEIKVYADGVVSAPDITAGVDGYCVNIEVKASNGSDDYPGNNPPDKVMVALAGAKFRNEIQVVDWEGKNTDSVLFRYPPLDREVEFEAVGLKQDDESYITGSASNWHISEVGTCTAIVPSGDPPARVLTSSDGVVELKLIYYTAGSDMGPSVSTTNDGKTEQLSGRTFPSVFYGGSATRNISFSGTLLDDTGEQFDDAVLSGLFIVRYPNGRRFAANLTITTNPTTTEMTSVSVSGQEVDF